MQSNPPKNFPCRKGGCNLTYSNLQNRSRHEKAAGHTPVIRKEVFILTSLSIYIHRNCFSCS